MLLSKEKTVLQDRTDGLTEIGRCYGMEMNVEKTKASLLLEIKLHLRQHVNCSICNP